jgi:hypothetical protein
MPLSMIWCLAHSYGFLGPNKSCEQAKVSLRVPTRFTDPIFTWVYGTLADTKQWLFLHQEPLSFADRCWRVIDSIPLHAC